MCRTARRPGHLTSKRAGRYGARECHRADGGHKCSPHTSSPIDSAFAEDATVISVTGKDPKKALGLPSALLLCYSPHRRRLQLFEKSWAAGAWLRIDVAA